MKKGEIYEGMVEEVLFPNKGIVRIEEENLPVYVKNAIVGQKVSVRITKKRSDKAEGQVVEILEKAPNEIEPLCPHFNECGGCTYQNLGYENQLMMKEAQIKKIFAPVIANELKKNKGLLEALDVEADDYFAKIFEGIKGSPISFEYRNKMEFSFGDACKDGQLELGLHKKGSFYDIVSVKDCQIVDEDYRKILQQTLNYFRGKGCSYYHKITHEGFLRHLLIRKSKRTNEILICLVTSSQIENDAACIEKGIIEDWLDTILNIRFEGKLAGVLHIINDSLSDVVQSDKTMVLYGKDYIEEELLGLKFKITPFSFFQTNSLSAEVIYSTAREYCNEIKGGTLFDLYTGTGTIAQLMAPVVNKVIGVEIVAEAVEAAKENAKLNGLTNCEFIADDVLKALDSIADKPNMIILDPPRDGVNPKALRKIIDYGVDQILYISCKPTSLARDFEMLMGCGYLPVRMCAVDQFPGTVHVETVVLLSQLRHKPDDYIDVDVDVAELEGTSAETKATYEKIKRYVAEHNDGMKVSNLYIAQVKRKCGLELAENFNLPKSEDSRQPQCPKEKEEAIMEALCHFGMIEIS